MYQLTISPNTADRRKSEKRLKKMIKKGKTEMDPVYKFINDTSTIHYACLYNNLKLVKKCIQNGVDLNLKGGKHRNTPIYFAIYNRNHKIVLYLLERGAQENQNGRKISEISVKLKNYCGLLLVEEFLGRNIKIIEYARQTRNLNLLNYCGEQKSSHWQRFPCLILFGMCYLLNQDMYCVVILYFLCSDLMISIKAAYFLNLFYSCEIMLKTIAHSSEYIIFTMVYCILLILMIKKYKKKVKHKGLSNIDIIRKAIEENAFNENNFCYICVSKKDSRTKHCYYCNICVKNFKHHCPCIDLCVNSDNYMIYHVYLTYTMIFLILHCIYIENTVKSKVLTGFIIFVCLLRLLVTFSENRKRFI